MKIRQRILELPQDRKTLSERIRLNCLTKSDQRVLLFIVRVIPILLRKLEKSRIHVEKLKHLIWGKKTESSRNILCEIDRESHQSGEEEVSTSNEEKEPLEPGLESETSNNDSSKDKTDANKSSNVTPIGEGKGPKKRKSGARGSNAHPESEQILIRNSEFCSGDHCPDCYTGKLYLTRSPGKFLKFVSQPILKAVLYLQEKLRCNGCGKLFGAKMPAEALGSRASESASAMIALLKYGFSFPFFRLSRLQKSLKMPISTSSLWEMLTPLIEIVQVIFKEMRRTAAQGEVVHNDDTVSKVLSLLKKKKGGPIEHLEKKKERKAVYTTGILSKIGNNKIILFFTSHSNAGENLEKLLLEREKHLSGPIQMSDASTSNLTEKAECDLSNCLTHLRRYFVKAYKTARKSCTFVILELKEVYRIEEIAKKGQLSPEQRLELHKQKSKPVMDKIKQFCETELLEKRVEENSQLGEAMNYFLNHWEELTAFLRIPGAPLTNDELEQKFKMVKIHLKNSYFYKTEHGALVGDMFMSIIHTCITAGANPFDYLLKIQIYSDEVKKSPKDWMPWNYEQVIAKLSEIDKKSA
jgi:transposase